MNGWWALPIAAFFVGLEGFYSGCETGLYCVSRARLELEARRGGRAARVLLALVRRDSWVLIAMLVGTTLGIELATWTLEHGLAERGIGANARQIAIALGLTAFAFFFGEALPKELYRRRPHLLMSASTPLIAASMVLFAPLVLLLRGLTALVELLVRAPGARPGPPVGRAQVLSFLDEGAGAGEFTAHAVELARNALALRATPVSRAMIAWNEVRTLDASADDEALRAALDVSEHTRLPFVEQGTVRGYVHLLDVLAERDPGPITDRVRPATFVDPDLPVHRALARLRGSGGRFAVVGEPGAPLGIVTLKDLLEEISGDLGDW